MDRKTTSTVDRPLENDADIAHQLRERVKELTFLYAFSSLLHQRDLTQDEIAQALVDRVATAYQYPDITCARLTLYEKTYTSENYADSPWQQHVEITDRDVVVGALTVGYLAMRPEADEGPFLQAERDLINQCAGQFGQVLGLRWLQATLAAKEERIRESEERYRTIFESSINAILIVSPAGAIIDANPAACTLFGYTAAEFGQINHLDLVDREDPRLAPSLAQRTRTGHFHGVLTLIRKDGARFQGEISSTEFRNAHGDAQISVFIQDVTERTEADSRLVQRETIYRQAINAAGAIAYSIEFATERYTFMSSGIERLTGYTLAELTLKEFGSLVLDAIPRGEYAGMPYLDAVQHSRSDKGRSIWECDYHIRNRFGEERWIYDVSVQIVNEQGIPTGAIGIVQDITERKLTEERLAASNARFQALFETMTQGVVYQKPDGQITLANPAALQILGLTLAQMQGRTSIDPRWRAVREDGSDFPGEEHPAMVALRTGQVVTDVLMGIHHPQRDEQRWIRIAAVPEFRPGETTPFRVFATFDDITDRRRAEQAIQESEARYRQLAEELERRVQERTAEVQDLYENAPCGYHTIDANGAYTMINQTNLTWMGRTREEVLGHPVQEFLTPESCQTYLDNLPKLIKEGAITDVEYELVRTDGDTVPVLLSASAIYDAEGRFIASRASIFDITQRKAAEQARRTSEARLNYLLANTPAAIFTLSLPPDTQVTFLSDSVINVLGYARQQFVDAPSLWQELVHPDDLPASDMILPMLLESNHALWEVRVRHADGAYRWMSMGMSLLRDDRGEPYQIIGYGVDIDAQKKASEALRLSEARLRSVLQHAPGVIFEIDSEGAILAVNREQHVAVVGRHITEIVPPQEQAVVMNALHTVFEQQQPTSYESSLVLSPQDVQHFISYVGPIRVDDKVNSAVVVTLEITDLKRMQAEIQARHDFARQVMDALGQGLVVSDRNNRAQYANPFMINLLGTDPTTPAKTQLDFVSEEDIPLVLAARERRPEETNRYEVRLRTASGVQVPVLVSSTPRWEAGQVVGRISLFTDLTELKAIEDSLRHNRDELHLLNTALQKALQLKDEFLSTMSHELRTPLTAILGIAESLQTEVYGALNERQLRSLKRIWESGQHLLELINDILDLSKLEAAQMELELEDCDVGEICQASLSLVKGMAKQKQQRIAMEMDPINIELRADRRRLKQMLVNLLSNAVKFTPESGELGLRVQGDAGRQVIRFAVWDKGVGIAAEDMERIFAPFTQLDNSLAREYSGTGLGLALVKQMARLHDGTIEVQSTPGEGSTFILTLPWRQHTDAPDQTGTAAPDTAAPDTAAPDTVTPRAAPETRSAVNDTLVLLAEDDEFNAEMLAEYLTFQGYRVEVAHNGRDAVRKAQELLPDLILMDIRMPVLDGLQATQQIRANTNPTLARVPIIAVTAQAMEGDAERCIAAGANAHIAKPYRFAEILAMIEITAKQRL